MGKTIVKKAKPVMLQGTSSHVGKSVLTAALCRILWRRGFSVAPFKAQNMALNSSVTADGGEIGRAQAFQAEAAGIPPTVDMNPVLLKPTGDCVSQVMIHGRVYGSMSAMEYHAFKKDVRKYVLESYRRLERAYDVIVIEGAGSPAEINLRKNDIANMGVARLAKSPVLIVGDIDRGGVFASIVGTMELLTEDERERVKGFLINKFRGDSSLLFPAIDYLEGRTGAPVLGVIPYLKDISLPDEDGVALDAEKKAGAGQAEIEIAVIKLPRISNFTDFDPFKGSASVAVRFVESPEDIRSADMVILPGTKNTLEDLLWLKKRGFEGAIKLHLRRGGFLTGICGGFQMLGACVKDPFEVESGRKAVKGLGIIEAETILMKEKNTFQVEAEAGFPGDRPFKVKGYEIHMGETSGKAGPFARIKKRNSKRVSIEDGACSPDGAVWGTYIHGIFDNDLFRQEVIGRMRMRKGLGGSGACTPYLSMREAAIDSVAKAVEDNVRMDDILRIIGVGKG
ncbi:MAG: cobyric acid synthase [Deltaproteobacteria bacterium]|nr:cobyric acid synthase [Deltaproteobacteria bacterium]